MREGYWVIRTYKAGSVGEKIKFWVDARNLPRSKRKLKMDAKKALANEASSVKTVARLLNANFGAGDYLVGLDYSKAGYRKLIKSIDGYRKLNEAQRKEAIWDAARHQLSLCTRRCQYALGKSGEELREVAITSDMDGKTGEAVRVHHHAVVNAAALEVIKQKWTLGGVAYKPLKAEDYYWIADYFLKQVRHIPDAKKYTSTRNMVRPQPKDRVAKDGRMLTPPKGSIVLAVREWKLGRPQYMRYILPHAADLGGTVYAKTVKKRE